MLCPKCNITLEPKELEVGLLSAACSACEGHLLPLMNYRYWQDRQPEVSESTDSVVEDSTGAKICPKCSKLMSKYRVGLQAENRIELCNHCDEIWLDKGEWALIKTLNLHECLSSVFTDAWQRNLRKQREVERIREHYAKVIGEDAFSKVESFKEWLDAHKNRAEILHYITTRFS